MNENSQLMAMAAELRAEGYTVKRDVRARSLDIPAFAELGDFVIDIVAEKELPLDLPRTGTLIIEIANRQGRPLPGMTARQRGLLSPPTEEEAVERFKQLGEAAAQRPDVDLEIRFFDVSADQAAARRLEKARISREEIEEAVRKDYGLWLSVVDQPPIVRAAVLARLWSRALRLTAWRHPGRRRRELKYADLRTIQKDLFDHRILTMPPDRYQQAHRAMMAIPEGGVFPCEAILSLEGQLMQLWRWAVERLEIKPERPVDQSISQIIDNLLREVQEVPDGDRRANAQALVGLIGLGATRNDLPLLLGRLHQIIDLRTLSNETFEELMNNLAYGD